MRNIKLMAEYECYPLWDLDQPGNVCPEDLDLSSELCARLYEWQEEYDKTLNEDYPADSDFESEEMKESFIYEAHVLLAELQNELGNEFNVVLSLDLEMKDDEKESGSSETLSELSVWMTTLATIAFLGFLAMFITSIFNDWSSVLIEGRVDDGVYYMGKRGGEVVVSKTAFLWSAFGSCVFPLAGVILLTLSLFTDSDEVQWRGEKPPFFVRVIFIGICGFFMVIKSFQCLWLFIEAL